MFEVIRFYGGRLEYFFCSKFTRHGQRKLRYQMFLVTTAVIHEN